MKTILAIIFTCFLVTAFTQDKSPQLFLGKTAPGQNYEDASRIFKVCNNLGTPNGDYRITALYVHIPGVHKMLSLHGNELPMIATNLLQKLPSGKDFFIRARVIGKDGDSQILEAQYKIP